VIEKELERLGELKYELTIDESAKEFLVRKVFHKDLGARPSPMHDAIEKHVQDALCQIIFREDFFKGTITVCREQESIIIV
jgi:ATP-dependent Clp protease ATP-binding subunit ClpA